MGDFLAVTEVTRLMIGDFLRDRAHRRANPG
jgi:hypothetical protein